MRRRQHHERRGYIFSRKVLSGVWDDARTDEVDGDEDLSR